MTKEQEEIDKKLDMTSDDEITINLLYQKIEILENMLKEKDKKIEELKQSLARNVAKNFTFSIKEAEKAKEDLEMLNRGWQIECEKKDNIIDLMAGYIGNEDITEIFCDGKEYCDEDCKQCVEQYFGRKAE